MKWWARQPTEKVWWRGQSAKCIAAYLYASSGSSESTTDLVFWRACHHRRKRNLAARRQDELQRTLLHQDIDIERLMNERRKINSFMGNVERKVTIKPSFSSYITRQQLRKRKMKRLTFAARLILNLLSRQKNRLVSSRVPTYSPFKQPDWPNV